MENNLNLFSDEELYIVTDYIIKSAKSKFDYNSFKSDLAPLDEDFIDYNILLEIITSKAADEPVEQIAFTILSKFLMSGFMVTKEEIKKMVVQKEKELQLEILASKIAMSSLQDGTHPTLVIQQISQLL